MISLLAIEIIHSLPRRSIYFVLFLPWKYLYVDLFMEFTPVVVVNGNIGECVYRLKKIMDSIN